MILLLATDKKGAEKWSGKQAKISTACQRLIQNIGSKVYFFKVISSDKLLSINIVYAKINIFLKCFWNIAVCSAFKSCDVVWCL